MSWASAPVIFEIDTLVWLREAGRRLGRPLTLADVPDELWDETLPAGVDAVWLMGVWERSPVGREIARGNEALPRAFRAALPDFRDGDNAGSPYCVRRYVVDEALGGPPALAAARAALARRGVRLVLDYVPNHVAPDHPWVAEHPEYFVRGTPEALAAAPEAWLDAGGTVIARGRDPYFPPWPDVVQLNAFDPRVREATAEVLASIGEQCDGVRCDMAMLLLTEVFARTWGEWAGSPPATGLLARRRRPAARDEPGPRAHRRGVLGPGVDAPAAGLRLLLRQAALRPAGARRRGRRPRSPARRPRVPAAAPALRGEPRRAPRRRRAAGRTRPRGGRHRRHPAGRDAVARGPAQGPHRAAAGLPLPATGRDAGREPARVLRPPGARRPARAARRLAPAGRRGLAGQRLLPRRPRLGLERRGRPRRTTSSS